MHTAFLHLRFFGFFIAVLGITLFVLGIFIPIFVSYWNGPPWNLVNGTEYGAGGSLPHSATYRYTLWQKPPAAYTIILKASQPVHIMLVENSSAGLTEDLGTSNTFYKSFIIWSGNWTLVLSASEDVKDLDFTLIGVMQTGYPLLVFPKYAIPVLLLSGFGLFLFLSFIRRVPADIASLPKELSKEGLFFSILIPALVIIDSILTYEAIKRSAFVYETNRMLAASYQAGNFYGITLEAVLVLLFFSISVFAAGLTNDTSLSKRFAGSALIASLTGSLIFVVSWDLAAFGLPFILNIQGPLLPNFVLEIFGASSGLISFLILCRRNRPKLSTT